LSRPLGYYRSSILSSGDHEPAGLWRPHSPKYSSGGDRRPYDIYQRIDSFVKIYPDRVRLYKFAEPVYIRRYDLGEYNPNPKKKNSSPRELTEEEKAEKDGSSLLRAKRKCLDLANSNEFDLMVTFTFNPKKIDRFDDNAVKRSLAGWLNHQRSVNGTFRYIVLPERHKSGALHFHGLFGGYKGKMVDSGKFVNGRKAYNLTSYKMGFTTAVKIDNTEKAASYVTKYITKGMPEFRNKQRYWRSNNLKMPLRILNPKGLELDNYEFVSAYKTPVYEMFEYKGVMSDKDILQLADYGRPRYDDLLISEWEKPSKSDNTEREA